MVENLKIGAIVCSCEGLIGDFVDIRRVLEHVRKLDDVVYSNEDRHLCCEESLIALKKTIEENDLNRLVIAACTSPFRKILINISCAEAGLSPYLVEWVNIREQCAWVHSSEPENAIKKVMDQITMAVARAPALKPSPPSVRINEEKCSGCGVCVDICLFGALCKDEIGMVKINDLLCTVCGLCGASCPEKAITIENLSDEELVTQAIAAFKVWGSK